ncbi:MAG: S41 family peptidase, partial [Syntrophomonadaceae bacterium]|nr:S41 family peptidase [Syntrophomonadaceae bacterium]
MKNNRFFKALNYFFSLIGFLFITGIILAFVTNMGGIGTLLSVMGLMKTYGLNEINTSQAIQGATAGIVDALHDPYSKYLDEKTWKDLRERLEAKFGGIGVYVLQDNEGHLKVVSPIKGTPAYKEGVKHGDIIIRINGSSSINMSTDDAVHLMRGDPGTQLLLGVYRESDRREYDFRIVREIINVPSVEARVTERNKEIGYIILNQFHSRSAQEMTDSLKQLVEKDQIKGLIIDLRNNGGGDFDVSIAISSIFLNGEDVVSVADRQNNKTVHRASGGKIDIPLVLLV